MLKIDTEKSIILGMTENDTDGLKLGMQGYFSNSSSFINYVEGELDGFTYGEFMTTQENLDGDYADQWYAYFIPEDKVVFIEEEPKKLRPFKNIYEFKRITSCAIGNVIIYKKKDCDAEYTVLLNGYVLMNGNVLGVYLGRRSYTLEELSDDYLYYDNGKWHPFGVEE